MHTVTVCARCNEEFMYHATEVNLHTTDYGIGIFCYFNTDGVINSIAKMTEYLKQKSIPFKNEFSDARWVFRFVLNLDKTKHDLILKSFN